MILLTILLTLFMSVPSFAATYYVDFTGGSDANNGISTGTPWKRVKGMAGVTGTAASATISGGDTIVFKGGVTWTASYPWAIVGGSASAVTYTTDHSWFSGGAWSQPLFDNQEASTNYSINSMMTASGVSYITLNDLKIYRCGPTLTQHTGACIWFTNSHHISLTNNTIEGYCGNFCVYFLADSGTNLTNFVLTGNDVSHTPSFVWIGLNAVNTRMTTINMSNNLLHDGASQLGATGASAGNHGDGFLHYFAANDNTNSTEYLDDFTFCNNKGYGDWRPAIGYGNGEDMSGWFYIEGAIKNTLICNNEFTLTPSQKDSGANLAIVGDGWLALRSYGNTSATNVWIFNNTISLPTSGALNGAFIYTDSGWTNLYIKNNIISMQEACTNKSGGATPTGESDYNEYRCANQGFTGGGWMTDGGHSIFGAGGSGAPNSNPMFVADFTDLHLTTASPGKGAGVNLSAVSGLSAFQQTTLNSDRDGVARGATWDMGAYEYQPPITSLTGSISLSGGVVMQ